ncbi:MAG TPA: hypothetical protein VF467_00735 [Afipia sp.]
MTTADFIAGCFWPLVIVFAVLLLTARNKELFRLIGAIAVPIGLFYFVFWLFFGQESLVGVVNSFIFIAVLGAAILWSSVVKMSSTPDLKSRSKRYGAFVLGIAFMFISCETLFLDLARPRIVLEGRVEKVRTLSGRGRERGADIAGRTVKAITPVYERLKLLPYVRVEVGRGSNYIYKIEYLAN